MKKQLILLSSLAAIFASSGAFAGSKVYSPNIEKGELEIEWKGNYDIDKSNSKDGAQKHKYAVGYGFTDYYASELYLIAENPAGSKGYNSKAVEWENRFQLTDQGKNFADVGLYLSFEKALIYLLRKP